MIDFKIHKFETFSGNSEVINYVVYSHTDFIDLLNIQIDHLIGHGRLILCINKNNLPIDSIYDNFDDVIFYDDGQTYGAKLLSCVNQISYDYILFIHDIDILISVDDIKISSLQHFLRCNNFDRVDFQLPYDFDNSGHSITDDDLYLVKSSNTDTRAQGYIYNVQPSIWKTETLRNILTKFSYLDYRTIEQDSVQEYSSQFNIFRLFSKKRYVSAFFTCLEPFRYLHITHGRNLISREESNDSTSDFDNIVDKYNLKNSARWKR